ncbi:hypothetical protein AMTRI_Chr12g241200 [Amborella trichopoda]
MLTWKGKSGRKRLSLEFAIAVWTKKREEMAPKMAKARKATPLPSPPRRLTRSATAASALVGAKPTNKRKPAKEQKPAKKSKTTEESKSTSEAKPTKESRSAKQAKSTEDAEPTDESKPTRGGRKTRADSQEAQVGPTVGTTIVIERCTQCNSFKERALKVEKGLKEAVPDVNVKINPEKPRRGCFEIRDENGQIFISLLSMSRPFKKMKDLNMDEVVADIIKKIK